MARTNGSTTRPWKRGHWRPGKSRLVVVSFSCGRVWGCKNWPPNMCIFFHKHFSLSSSFFFSVSVSKFPFCSHSRRSLAFFFFFCCVSSSMYLRTQVRAGPSLGARQDDHGQLLGLRRGPQERALVGLHRSQRHYQCVDHLIFRPGACVDTFFFFKKDKEEESNVRVMKLG